MVPDISVVIISFNTRDLLRDCLGAVYAQNGVTMEVIVVDNASRDGSADMVSREFPAVRLVRSPVNRGFGGANNDAFALAQGRYVVLLNSDAFPAPGAFETAVRTMDLDRSIGLAGARLVGRDGALQPSARLFPSPLNDALCLTGLAARFPKSRFFGRADRTWADPGAGADIDWVPGAFAIVRRHALEQVGYFDERFFLYYEEVDLCRRLKTAGWRIAYRPELTVIHIGGESSRQVEQLQMSSSGSQLTLWRMRSALLYYRKHHGAGARIALGLESAWHRLRLWRNRLRSTAGGARAEESSLVLGLLRQAWNETKGGRVSPAQPW